MPTLPALKQTKYTYQDYLNFPDDGNRYQIIEGEVYVTAAPIPYHQKILLNFVRALDPFVRENNWGELFFSPCAVRFSEEDVVEPDILVIARERTGIIGEKDIQGAPDLIIEAISSSTTRLDREDKLKLYEKNGVKEYWIADPKAELVEVRILGEGKYKTRRIYKKGELLESKVLEGLKVDLKEIFTGAYPTFFQ